MKMMCFVAEDGGINNFSTVNTRVTHPLMGPVIWCCFMLYLEVLDSLHFECHTVAAWSLNYVCIRKRERYIYYGTPWLSLSLSLTHSSAILKYSPLQLEAIKSFAWCLLNNGYGEVKVSFSLFSLRFSSHFLSLLEPSLLHMFFPFVLDVPPLRHLHHPEGSSIC